MMLKAYCPGRAPTGGEVEWTDVEHSQECCRHGRQPAEKAGGTQGGSLGLSPDNLRFMLMCCVHLRALEYHVRGGGYSLNYDICST
jgi:hypothetical protein